jgi:hypothetical protein
MTIPIIRPIMMMKRKPALIIMAPALALLHR